MKVHSAGLLRIQLTLCRWTCSSAMASDISPTDKDLNLGISLYRERTAVRVVLKMLRYALGLWGSVISDLQANVRMCCCSVTAECCWIFVLCVFVHSFISRSTRSLHPLHANELLYSAASYHSLQCVCVCVSSNWSDMKLWKIRH